MERQFKGIFIPAEIWEDTNLSWNEKIVLMEIDSFTSAGKDCFISDEYIGQLVGCSTRTASTMVSKLAKLGYIKRTRSDGRKRYLVSAISEQLCKICGAELQNLQNTYNKITKVSSINIEDTNIGTSAISCRFVKPSVDDIASYCRERNNGIDPQNFFDFYESKGWMVGRTKMKDWKASVRTWEAKRKASPSRKGKDESLADYYENLIKDLHKDETNERTGIDEQ